MATKPKAAPKSQALVATKPKSTAVVNIQAALKTQAQAVAGQVEPPSGFKIRLKNKQFTLPDGRKSPGPLEVVILDFVTTHAYYETDFDAKNPTPPACFAIGNDPKNMVPSPNSPVQQSTECKTCPMNQFGPNNERKACTNRRLMAVLPPDADESTPIWTIETAPMSNKAFDAYVSGIVAAKGVPPIGVVTEISLDPNVDYAKLVFGLVDDNPAVGEMLGRQEEAKKLLAVEPNTSSYAAPTKKAAGARRR